MAAKLRQEAGMIVYMHVERAHLVPLHCRFVDCLNPVVGIFHVPEGCLCWDDPVQSLCDQHAINSESTGPITCVVDFRKYSHPPELEKKPQET